MGTASPRLIEAILNGTALVEEDNKYYVGYDRVTIRMQSGSLIAEFFDKNELVYTEDARGRVDFTRGDSLSICSLQGRVQVTIS